MMSQNFTLLIIRCFKTTSENHVFEGKSADSWCKSACLGASRCWFCPSFDFSAFYGYSDFSSMWNWGFHPRSRSEPQPVGHIKMGVETGFVDEDGLLRSTGGWPFRSPLCLLKRHGLSEPFPDFLYPSASATSLPQNRGSPCSSLFHHLSEDIVNKSKIQYIGKI